MPTVMTHAVVGIGLGRVFTARKMPASYWLVVAVLPMVPDLDVLAFRLGIPYGNVLGHRGLTHSLWFALLMSYPLAGLTWRRLAVRFPDWLGFLFLVAASHGLLDALTNGGRGVAFFAPFDDRRYFFPWQPIEVSPIGLGFFSARGVTTLLSEVTWVWLPTGAVVAAVEGMRSLRARGAKRQPGPRERSTPAS